MRILEPADRRLISRYVLRSFVLIQKPSGSHNNLCKYLNDILMFNWHLSPVPLSFSDWINIYAFALDGSWKYVLNLSRAHAFANGRYLLQRDRVIARSGSFPRSFEGNRKTWSGGICSVCSKLLCYLHKVCFFPQDYLLFVPFHMSDILFRLSH